MRKGNEDLESGKERGRGGEKVRWSPSPFSPHTTPVV